MDDNIKRMLSNNGFTIIEFMIAICITGFVMAAIFGVFISQQKSYTLHEQVTNVQQNLRAAMLMTSRDVRMAGCDPTGKAGAGVIVAGPSSIQFTMDIYDGVDNDSDGIIDEANELGNVNGNTNDSGETISYYLFSGDLVRNSDSEIIAENIDALNFVYLDQNGNKLDDDGNGNVTISLSSIRSVQITIVGKTGKADTGYTDTNDYYNKQGDPILAQPDDNFRRKQLTTQIKCRNL